MDLLQRVTSGCGSQFEVIESALFSVFLPSLFGHVITPSDRLLFSLPTCMGGLNTRIPTLSFENDHDSSIRASQLIISALKGLCQFSLYDHNNFVSDGRSDFYKAKCALETELFSNIFDNVDHNTQRYLLHNQTSLSHWLTAMPVMKDGFHLSANDQVQGRSLFMLHEATSAVTLSLRWLRLTFFYLPCFRLP